MEESNALPMTHLLNRYVRMVLSLRGPTAMRIRSPGAEGGTGHPVYEIACRQREHLSTCCLLSSAPRWAR